MTPTAHVGSVPPGAVDPEKAARALRRINDYLAHSPSVGDEFEVLVEGGGEQALVLPRQAVEMFTYILGAMSRGQGVQVYPLNAELTTQQAADLLNVSRPYLIGLLERGEIDFRLVGRHRRVRFDAVMDYRRQDDLRRRGVVDELSQLGQDLGDD
ncbi:excisionase family DNA-binding protein [Streptosporangium sp. KLBMP 9127]|nr:excisionase family DNA-binding protein [Streptosporangium sp. KLBMP 9127]